MRVFGIRVGGPLSVDERRRLTRMMWVTPGICAVSNMWLRGPVFGLFPFTLVTAPLVLLIGWGLFQTRWPERFTLPLATLIAFGIFYGACAPPSTSSLLSYYLNCNDELKVRDWQRWDDNWTRDPSFHLRFHADAEVIQRIVECADLRGGNDTAAQTTYPGYEREVKHPTVFMGRMLLPVPSWWRPEELNEPRRWAGQGPAVIHLWYDEQTGLVYLSFLTL